ncbi:MAG: discoidin domain-containing protein [Fibrobacterales bacterium]
MKLSNIIKSTLVGITCITSIASAANYSLVSQIAEVTASSIESTQYPASNLTDGNKDTRWASEFADGQEVILDLRSSQYIDRVALTWEGAYASTYTVSTSNDLVHWEFQYTQVHGMGGVEVETRDMGKFQYVKIALDYRATSYGFSLYEVEVFTDLDLHLEATTIKLNAHSDWGRKPLPSCDNSTVGTIAVQKEGHYTINTVVYSCVSYSAPNLTSTLFGWVKLAEGAQLLD